MPLAAGQSLTFYEILGPLGAGGMGEVYRARDTRLEREVAIKVLPEELADDEERLRRFDREAKTLASLNHPNVAGIHGIDQVDEICFIAMELVPGEDLAARIARGPLPVNEALDVCHQIAEGLEAAHEAGVVHRDLKPANVRITPKGVVKLLDFGLAKPLRPETPDQGTTAAEPDSALMTGEGLVLGTPTYMSPEQANGEPVDRRTDVWAFGCVLYECLTGTRVFSGGTTLSVIAAVMECQPDWGALPRATPPAVERLLRRCLVKDPGERLRDIGEARLALIEAKRSETADAAAAATRPQSRTLRVVMLIALALTLTFFVRWKFGRGSGDAGGGSGSIEAVVVLPFTNESGDAAMDYLSDGIAESVINRLSSLPDLRVVPRSTAFRYRGSEPEDVADELGVRGVVTGRVNRRGEHLIIGVELTDAAEVSQLWGDRFDTPLDEILSVESNIANRITEALRSTLSGGGVDEADEVDGRYTKVPAAHLAYMEARHAWNTRSAGGFQRALELYDRAIAADPTFALAHASKAETYVMIMVYEGPPGALAPELQREVAAAIRLDPNLAEVYPALGFELILEQDWAGSEAAFQRAIELRPNYSIAHHWYSVYLLAIGDLEGRLRETEEARRLDPGSLIIATDVGYSLAFLRRTAEAAEVFREVLDASPGFWRALDGLACVDLLEGRYAEAARNYEAAREIAGELAWNDGLVAMAHGIAGNLDRAREELRILEQRAVTGYVSPFGFARAYLGLGDMDRCFEWLERALTEHDPLFMVGLHYMHDAIAEDPRWPALERRMNFPE
jgi:serine/threonine protein kinase/tetratricopeptide (TPR) repeat protein